MASIHQEIANDAPPGRVWDAVRDVGAIHGRLAPGFVVDTRVEDGARVVTFGNGMVARELIVDLKDRDHAVILASSAKAAEVEHYLDLIDARDMAGTPALSTQIVDEALRGQTFSLGK